MGIDLKRARERKQAAEERAGSGSNFEKFSWRKYNLLGLLPPSEAMDGAFWLEFFAHSNVGPNGRFHVCADVEKNPILASAAFEAALERWNERARRDDKDEKDLDGYADGCPDCKCIAGEDGYEHLDPIVEGQKSMLEKMKYVSPVAVFGQWDERPEGTPLPQSAEEWESIPFHIVFLPKTVFDGIFDVVEAEGDISNPRGATLVWAKREIKKTRGRNGKTYDKVDYSVDKDSATLKNPLVYPKAFRMRVDEAMADDGDCDPFRMLVAMCKSTIEMEAHLRGLDVDKETGEKPSAAQLAGVSKRCFAVAAQFGVDDPECQVCEYKVKCAKALGQPVPPDPGQKSQQRAKPAEDPKREDPPREEPKDPDPRLAPAEQPVRRGPGRPRKQPEPPKPEPQPEPMADDTPFDGDADDDGTEAEHQVKPEPEPETKPKREVSKPAAAAAGGLGFREKLAAARAKAQQGKA